jgi:hypothetical protein
MTRDSSRYINTRLLLSAHRLLVHLRMSNRLRPRCAASAAPTPFTNALHASCERIDRNADHAVNRIDKLSP